MKNRISVAVLAAALLSSCVTDDMSATDKRTIGSLIGAAAGAYGGAKLGGGKGGALFAALGGAAGAWAGGKLADFLGPADRSEMNRGTEMALNDVGVGQGVRWTNPDSGNEGSIMVDEERQARFAVPVPPAARPGAMAFQPLLLVGEMAWAVSREGVAAPYVDVRAAPDPEAAILDRLAEGEEVVAVGKTLPGHQVGAWVLVSRDDVSIGYVREHNLFFNAADVPPASRPPSSRPPVRQASVEMTVPCRSVTQSIRLKDGRTARETVEYCRTLDGWSAI